MKILLDCCIPGMFKALKHWIHRKIRTAENG